jgi:hypothetical protein
MIINVNKYQKVLDIGLTLDHYHVLISMREEQSLPKSKRIQGFINLLSKKGYIEDGCLTEIALKLIDSYITTTTTCTTIQPLRNEDGKVDFKEWTLQLHKKCQDKIKYYTGSPQIRGKINGKGHSFLCNSIDLGKVLFKVINLYKLKDLDAVESCIMKHITECCLSKQYFPLIKYYIIKDNESKLVTDLENPEIDKPEFKSTQKFI